MKQRHYIAYAAITATWTALITYIVYLATGGIA